MTGKVSYLCTFQQQIIFISYWIKDVNSISVTADLSVQRQQTILFILASISRTPGCSLVSLVTSLLLLNNTSTKIWFHQNIFQLYWPCLRQHYRIDVYISSLHFFVLIELAFPHILFCKIDSRSNGEIYNVYLINSQ